MQPVFLIGFMGAGKTTLGRALSGSNAFPGAARLDYVDLDELIERHEGLSVREIFRTRGEAAFRSLESRMLREAACRNDVIIGCGGVPLPFGQYGMDECPWGDGAAGGISPCVGA